MPPQKDKITFGCREEGIQKTGEMRLSKYRPPQHC